MVPATTPQAPPVEPAPTGAPPLARALVVGIVDRPDEARRLRALLRGRPEGRRLRIVGVPSLAAARRMAASAGIDCLVVPTAEVAAARAAAPDVALLGLVDDEDDDAALTALRGGAQDCLEPTRLVPAEIARAVRFAVERHHAQADLRRRALHDPLTTLPNRVLLHDRLEHALAAMRRDGGSVAVVFVDLDGFKEVNDRFGHHAGDAVLAEMARRLVAGVRPGDTVARYGGDEFTIVCAGAGRVELAAVVRRLGRALAEPIVVDGRPLRLGASFGTAFAADAAESPDSVLRRADAAMYVVKRQRTDEVHDLTR